MAKIVNFSVNPYLSHVCSWEGTNPEIKKAKASEILKVKITPRTEIFSYIDDFDICLGYFALHSNPNLKIGIVEFVRFNPSISKIEDHFLPIVEFIIDYFKQKNLDSFEIEVTHIPESILTILNKRRVVESKILEKKIESVKVA